eukprot:TRINITY_DN19327_c0_g1_i1.p1 TRINITY_DN19327_c0_g1~~TRINITY_DN19327_c0_g1_i1.p1  ORF type:complete len:440 (+),score=137.12 TRINITY_DN19327_c0_g1_i1:68-1387(+)
MTVAAAFVTPAMGYAAEPLSRSPAAVAIAGAQRSSSAAPLLVQQAKASSVDNNAASSNMPSVATRAAMGVGAAMCAYASQASLRSRARTSRMRRRGSLLDMQVEEDEVDEAASVAKCRPCHWVIRSTELERTLKFLKEVFGMKVLRHEENATPCAITCNGNYQTPWSKTMVGYRSEDDGYCLEVTYNYGVDDYPVGGGLAYFTIGVDDPDAALKKAEELGCELEGNKVTGPDGYKFRIVQQPKGRVEQFHYVVLRVENLAASFDFYRQIGMHDMTAELKHHFTCNNDRGSFVGYKTEEEVPLLLLERKNVKLEQWEGRNAIVVPDCILRRLYNRVVEESEGSVKHPIREFNELPQLRRIRGLPPMSCEVDPDADDGKPNMAVAIVSDVDGYEICLVSADTYNPAVRRAYNPDADIDWKWRETAWQEGMPTNLPQMPACV